MKNKLIRVLSIAGFGWFTPVIRLATGEDANEQIREILLRIGVPVMTFAIFLLVWNGAAAGIETNLGRVPGPAQVLEQVRSLAHEYKEERRKEVEFYKIQAEKNAAKLAANPSEPAKNRKFTGKPTYLDQIFTSLRTVFTGFLIASVIAVPLGILCGLSRTLSMALTPLIQIFKPVSPVAWLPIVTMIVSSIYVVPREWLPKSYIISSVTVSLCCLWPSLINTSLGVASIDKDYLNVARVLKLGFFNKIFKIVIPSSLPYIFAGLRISLGVGWIVLIASEMLSQNPGLGKFVWDEFQNGSSQSLARIMVAVFTIGIIGFILDRVMVTLHSLVSYTPETH